MAGKKKLLIADEYAAKPVSLAYLQRTIGKLLP
jgi:hypothetical protein